MVRYIECGGAYSWGVTHTMIKKANSKRVMPAVLLAITLLLTMAAVLSFVSETAEGATVSVTNGNDSGAGSLRDALAAASSGDTITFDPSVTTVTLTAELNFSQSGIIIDGGAGVTITKDPTGAFRVLNSTANTGTLTLIGLKIENGNVTGNGGGLLAASSVTMVDCVLYNNKASSSGGALYVSGAASIVDLTNCIITNNTASGAYMGKVVHVLGSINMKDCAVAYNTSWLDTVYCRWALSAVNCTFFSNTLTGSMTGGIVSGEDTITLQQCTITKNNRTGTQLYMYNVYNSGQKTNTIINCIITKETMASNINKSVFPETPGYDNLLGVDATGDYAAWFGTNVLKANYIKPLPSIPGIADAASIEGLERDAAGNLRQEGSWIYGAVNINDDTETLLESSDNPSVIGSSVTFTATVKTVSLTGDTPTGVVEFYVNGGLIGNAALDASGTAVFSTSSLTVGTHEVFAYYVADPGFIESCSDILEQTVLAGGKTYFITASASDGATISPNGTVTAEGGTTITFSFAASSVTVNGVALSQAVVDKGSYTFYDVRSNHTIVVKGAPPKAPIDATVGVAAGNGSIQYSVDGSAFAPYTPDVVLREGSTVVFKAVPGDGYEFKEWLLDGISYSTSETVTFPGIASPLILSSAFEEKSDSGSVSNTMSLIAVAFGIVAIIAVAGAFLFFKKGAKG